MKGSFPFLSNFHLAQFKDAHGTTFRCSEQYFMYSKWLQFDSCNQALGRKIMDSHSPVEIKKLGRQVKNFDERVWDTVAYDAMVAALRLKFAGSLRPKVCNEYECREIRLKFKKNSKFGANLNSNSAHTIHTHTNPYPKPRRGAVSCTKPPPGTACGA
ncbi:hypothetical protein B484DRAFT_322204 [Ochromonadaceae sp. CCMP2298]|nr:hypothetical protein B484DRAFT_322204 [Ochromonadaceae sp. CCMP2298]